MYVVTNKQYDLRHSKHWELKGLSPDVLVMPSKLAPMAKEVRFTPYIHFHFIYITYEHTNLHTYNRF